MRKKLMCLILALLMIVPICLMAGCGELNFGGSDTDTDSDTSEADETTETLTMFLITERHVPTAAELETIKTEKGGDSAEYREAYYVRESYERVAAEINKITKAKFRTQLIVSFYTEEEYKVVEELMAYQAKEALIRAEAKAKLKKYTREKKAFGIKDTAQIQKMFYIDYPEYASYSEAIVDPDDTVVTEAETIKNEYGITELKYPDAVPNQVDIICVCGYDNYLRYIDNGWLAELNDELNGSSKAILTYVNEKFMDAAQQDGTTYGIPNNKAIGDYKYLLINKYWFEFYQYNEQSITSLTNDYVLDFLTEMQLQNEANKGDASYNEILPFVSTEDDLSAANVIYWAMNYEYAKVENFSEFEKGVGYYYLDTAGNYNRVHTAIEDGTTYYTATEAQQKNLTEFKSGVTYYTKDSFGFYVQADSYKAGETYYTITKYTAQPKLTSFTTKDVYFIASGSGYIQVITPRKGMTYYTVQNASLDRDSFSLAGGTINKMADEGAFVGISSVTSRADYRNQLIRIQTIKDQGLYTNADAVELHKNGQEFAMAVISGGKELEETFSDDYFMIVLEYPRAYASEVCSNLFAVNASTQSLSRSMKIITYITTNEAFRNLIQYGVEGIDYTTATEIVGGKSYTTVTRLNNYYQMDIYKTGNTFIAYPEENMSYNIWDYGKLQNREALYDTLAGFDVNEYAQNIDFSLFDRIKALSDKYEALLAECKTAEEVTATLTAANAAMTSDPYIQYALNTSNPHSLYVSYYQWYDSMGYAVS